MKVNYTSSANEPQNHEMEPCLPEPLECLGVSESHKPDGQKQVASSPILVCKVGTNLISLLGWPQESSTKLPVNDLCQDQI